MMVAGWGVKKNCPFWAVFFGFSKKAGYVPHKAKGFI
jgi:hypothetical protein